MVLSDGEDNKSKLKLDELVSKVKGANQRQTIQAFTFAYGEGAGEKAFQAIAEAAQARSYKGTPENIRAIFQDITAFF